MNTKKISFSVVFTFASLSLFAQSNYAEAIQEGDNALQRSQYTIAIKKYLIAETFDQSKWKTIQAKLDNVYKAIDSVQNRLKELEQSKRNNPAQSPANTVTESSGDGVKKPISTTATTSQHKSPPSVKWNDFLRLYDKPVNQWFFNIGYDINAIPNVTYKDSTGVVYGNSFGLNFGSRHGMIKKMGIGYQAGIGLGFNGSGTYLHWSIGGKFYPWNCLFLSANYSAVGMKKYHGKNLFSEPSDEFYYKIDKVDYYGLSLLGGADICFGKKTTDKCGGIINIAVGTVFTEGGKCGFAFNLGLGLVFRK